MLVGHISLTRSAGVNTRFSFRIKAFAMSFPDRVLRVGKPSTASMGSCSHRPRTCPKLLLETSHLLFLEIMRLGRLMAGKRADLAGTA